ncbi:MAG TPA: hypothetical protein VJN95_14300 [Gemmatimonadales bacterium]|nr:hypothetical protein [Gemmatimonadales bacterium]
MGFLIAAVRSRWLVPVVVITAITLGLVGVVVLATTPAGCGTLLGKGSSICNARPVARLGSPSSFPSPSPVQSPVQYTPPAAPNTSSNPPYDPGVSAYPPYNPGASESYYPPGTNLASGEYPPFPSSTSGLSAPQIALSCRLPVYAGPPGSGGFIVFPGGNFIADPRSAVTAPAPPGGWPSPAPSYGGPGQAGWWGLTYDAAYSKWLPVPWTWVSPDGSRYAYPAGGDIYVQDLANGTQSELGAGHSYAVLSVQPEGVYVIVPNQPGLWLLAYGGGTTEISAAGFWQAESNHAAYGTETSAVPPGVANTITRLDVKRGVVTRQFSELGAQSNVVGFDAAGDPVILANYNNGQVIWLAFNAGGPTALAYNGYGGPFPYGTPIADSHGIWYAVGQGIVIYAGGAWSWMSTVGAQLAGPCS